MLHQPKMLVKTDLSNLSYSLYYEKEGSYFTIKQVWCPIQIMTDSLDSLFDGKLKIENRYDFVMRTYNAIGSIIAAVVNESIHIHTLHALIGQYPKETSGTTGMLTHHFPIIIQSGSVYYLVEQW